MSHPSSPSISHSIVDEVRDRYGRIATGETSGCGCACGGAETAISQSIGYSAAELSALPDEANLGLGCGAPIGFLHLAPGETVVDLGSGAGIDSFLAARAVGPTGRVIGVDMTPEMIERARAAAARLDYVCFRSSGGFRIRPSATSSPRRRGFVRGHLRPKPIEKPHDA
jgi:SAM-dependent methyltransferase